MSLPFNFSSQRLSPAGTAATATAGIEARGMTTFELKFGDRGSAEPALVEPQPFSPYLAQWGTALASESVQQHKPAPSESASEDSPSALAPAESIERGPSASVVLESSPLSATPSIPFIPTRPRQEVLPRASSIPPAPADPERVVPEKKPSMSLLAGEVLAQIAELKLALGHDLGRSQHATEQRLDELAADFQREMRDLKSLTDAETQQIKDDLFSAAMGMSALRDQQQIIVAELNAVRAVVAQQAESTGTAPDPEIAGQISGMQETLAALGHQTADSMAVIEEAVRLLGLRLDRLADTSSNLRNLGERVDSLAKVGATVKTLETRLDALAVAATSIKPMQSRLDGLASVADAMQALDAKVDMLAIRELGVLKHRTERAEERAARAIAALESISDSQKLAAMWNVPEEPPEAQKYASYDKVTELAERIEEMSAKMRFSDTLLKSVESSVMERCEQMVKGKMNVMADETTAAITEMESRLHRQMSIEAPEVEEPEGCGLLAMDPQTEQRVVELVEELVSGKLKALVAPLVRADLSRMLGAILPMPIPTMGETSAVESREIEGVKEVRP